VFIDHCVCKGPMYEYSKRKSRKRLKIPSSMRGSFNQYIEFPAIDAVFLTKAYPHLLRSFNHNGGRKSFCIAQMFFTMRF